MLSNDPVGGFEGVPDFLQARIQLITVRPGQLMPKDLTELPPELFPEKRREYNSRFVVVRHNRLISLGFVARFTEVQGNTFDLLRYATNSENWRNGQCLGVN